MIDTQQTFNNEAKEYEFASRAVLPFYDEALDFLISEINLKNTHPVVLDLCCGTGILTDRFFKKYPEAEVVGLDFSTEMLSIATHRLNNKNFKAFVCDICDKQTIDKLLIGKKFDLIISSFGIHNIHGYENKKLSLSYLLPYLKNNGTIYNLDLIKGKDETEIKHFFNYQKDWISKSYNAQETDDWVKLLDEEDEPETLLDYFKMYKELGLKNVDCLWIKEYIAIWKGKKSNTFSHKTEKDV